MEGYFHTQTITHWLTLIAGEIYEITKREKEEEKKKHDFGLFLQDKTSHTNSTFSCDLLQMQSPVEIKKSALKNITFPLFNSQFEPALQLSFW